MKGLIFNLLEDFLDERCGAKGYDEILDAAELANPEPGLMVGPGEYPDHDFTSLIATAAERLGVASNALLEEFGRTAITGLAQRYPQFFDSHAHPAEFLSSLGFIHLMEVRKLYQDAEPPKITTTAMEDGGLRLTYSSGRRLCPFFSGLMNGVADYYCVPMRQRHTACVLRGDPECVFELTFDTSSAAGAP